MWGTVAMFSHQLCSDNINADTQLDKQLTNGNTAITLPKHSDNITLDHTHIYQNR